MMTTRRPKTEAARQRQEAFEKVEIDEEKVFRLASNGCTVADIAVELEVSEPTLRTRSADALKRGRARRNMSLMRAMYKAAVEDGNVQAMKFLAMQWFGWQEKREYTDERLDMEIRLELEKRGIHLPEDVKKPGTRWGQRAHVDPD